MFMPIDDRTLSLILGRALALADDDRITDPEIVALIRGAEG